MCERYWYRNIYIWVFVVDRPLEWLHTNGQAGLRYYFDRRILKTRMLSVWVNVSYMTRLLDNGNNIFTVQVNCGISGQLGETQP